MKKRSTSIDSLKNLFRIREFGVLVALILLCVFLSFASPYFLKPMNIFNVLRQISIIGILAVGQCLVIIIGCLDLSAGTTMGLMGVLCAIFIGFGIPPIVAFVLVIASGALIGTVNGLLVTRFGVNAFIVTLGMQYIARSVALLITGGIPVKMDSPLAFLGGGYIGAVPMSVIIMGAIVLLGWLFSTKTLLGRNIFIVGSNEKAAKLSGIRAGNVKMMVFIIMGSLAGLSGIILTGMLKTAEPSAGLGYELEAIAAVIIGGTSLSGGEGSIFGAIIGAALMGVLKNGFVLLGVSGYWQMFALGVVIIMAVLVDSMNTMKSSC
ncbi:ABC transporter permease [Vallitalea pronyensis]|uniref:ABC transporter permease n=1 Tax=Vallitalea pronyensis TaxID=1348613 RepID=A0A8J8MQ54_9FIRM|nr:ABC transporter permease [Vallitalea pronyensis]QUI25368.1 ABC transporter permease [Vallitalea pronyensis]